MENLETGIMAVLWNDVLQRFNTISLMLQDPQLDLNSAIALFDSLIEFTTSLRSMFVSYEQKGKELTGNEIYPEETRRKRTRNTQMEDCVLYGVAGTPENSSVETPADRFRVDSFIPIVDKLVQALTHRRDAYSFVSEKFGFLRRLTTLTVDEIETYAKALVELYTADLEPELSRELNFLASILRSGFPVESANVTTKHKKLEEAPELQMYHVVMNNVVLCDSIPNVVNMLCIYLSLMVSNCSGERSFSILKRVKNYLRSTIGNVRMSDLSLLCIEHEVLDSLPVNEIISDFASLKVRKSYFKFFSASD